MEARRHDAPQMDALAESDRTKGRPNRKEPKPGIVMRDVSLWAGERNLLKNTSAEFPPGEITLIVGPSGVGKSVLLRLMAGLIDGSQPEIEFTGLVSIDGSPAKAGQAGIVFQSFALFDELSPTDNLEIARASGISHAIEKSNQDLLQELKIPTSVPTSRLSGGQKQRLAIARTLAYNPQAILYDEPTSGLDPLTGQQVALLLRQTHDLYRKTSVIVTHDYLSLIPIADRIYLFDSENKRLVPIPRDQWSEIPKRLAEIKTVDYIVHPIDPSLARSSLIGRSISRFFSDTTEVMIDALKGFVSLVPVWKNPVWGLRFVIHYARLIYGPTACIYLLTAGIIAGFVATYFTFQFLPYAAYSEPLLAEDLLTALGFALYRIIVPVLVCILVAARCGAAVAADVGGRQLGNQIDALKTFGLKPQYYLQSPILWGFIIGMPLLNGLAYLSARGTSLITFSMADPLRGPDFWQLYFDRGLKNPEGWLYFGFNWLLAKLLVCGLGTAIIAYRCARQPMNSSTDVSRAVTSTILWSTLFVLVVHFVFALIEYRGAVP